MILKASKRGGAKQLARHLLNGEKNEHVTRHEVSGFAGQHVNEALNEIYAISQGTKCTRFMFSLSLNPPQDKQVPTEAFEDALAKIEKKLGMEGQPRIVVFHEKEGRRHAHCVWLRINEDMKAIDLPFFKNRLKKRFQRALPQTWLGTAHMLFLDGVYTTTPWGKSRFHRTNAPNQQELRDLVHTISHRVGGFLEREGILERDEENSYLNLE